MAQSWQKRNGRRTRKPALQPGRCQPGVARASHDGAFARASSRLGPKPHPTGIGGPHHGRRSCQSPCSVSHWRRDACSPPEAMAARSSAHPFQHTSPNRTQGGWAGAACRAKPSIAPRELDVGEGAWSSVALRELLKIGWGGLAGHASQTRSDDAHSRGRKLFRGRPRADRPRDGSRYVHGAVRVPAGAWAGGTGG